MKCEGLTPPELGLRSSLERILRRAEFCPDHNTPADDAQAEGEEKSKDRNESDQNCVITFILLIISSRF